MRLARHSATIAWRTLIKTTRTPEQLLDVTLQPALFLVIFTYIFGGAIAAGSQHDYLQFLLPGLLGQSIALGGVAIGVNLNSDLEKGIFDRFRALPIARSAPLVGAVMADIVRYAARRRLPRLRLRDRLPGPDRRAVGGRRVRARDRLRAVLLLDLGLGRHGRPHVRRGAGDRDAGRTRSPAPCRRSPTTTRSASWSPRCAGC